MCRPRPTKEQLELVAQYHDQAVMEGEKVDNAMRELADTLGVSVRRVYQWCRWWKYGE